MRFPLILSVLLGLSMSAVAREEKQEPPSAALKQTARASNDFACDLFQVLAKENAGKNVFFSPWSVSSALAMTMEGARNDTAAEMGQVLRLPKELKQGTDRPWRLDPYHQGFADMQRRCSPPRDRAKDEATRAKIAELRKDLEVANQFLLKRDTAEFRKKAEELAATINKMQETLIPFELNVANAIWGEKTYPFDPKYVEAVGGHYGTGLVREADFINEFAAERLKINRWVEDRTNDKIKDLIPKIEPDQAKLIRMILVNAIYFKGQWSVPFDKRYSLEELFLNADGTKSKTIMMQAALPARYAAFQADGTFFDTPSLIEFGGKQKLYPEADGFLVAEFPYKGEKLAMTVIVPRSPNGLAALEKKLNGETLTRWFARLQSRTVYAKMPRFRMETDYSLADVLEGMGMKKAFTEGVADFRGMTTSSAPKDKLHISRVLHKAFVDVNEEGTEAAAATAVILDTPKSAAKAVPFNPEFHADRPFLFAIREVETGAVLFMGRMTTPGK